MICQRYLRALHLYIVSLSSSAFEIFIINYFYLPIVLFGFCFLCPFFIDFFSIHKITNADICTVFWSIPGFKFRNHISATCVFILSYFRNGKLDSRPFKRQKTMVLINDTKINPNLLKAEGSLENSSMAQYS